MTALLRADWLRFRRRRDLWIIAIAALLLTGVSFLSGWRTDVTDSVYPTAAQIRQEAIDFGFFQGGTQAEIDQQIDQYVTDSLFQFEQQRVQDEANQAIKLQRYDLPQAPFTLLGSGFAPLIALILIATLIVGDEFRYGTVRTSLLAAAARRRFLGARLITLGTMTVALYLALILLAIVLALGLRLIGAEVRSSTIALDLGASAAWFGAQVLGTLVVLALAVALTVLLRSGAMPLLLIILAALIELFVLALPVFRPGEFLAGVPLGSLTMSLRTLVSRLAVDTHAMALAETEVPSSIITLPLVVVTAIVVAWGVLFLLIADRRFRTMDIVE